MKDKHTQTWIPLYVDKWIFGSTRIELEPAERAVFIDLMVLGAKDEGYIRANETTPFLEVQLAGLLNIPLALLQSTLSKCIQYGKLDEGPEYGIYRLCNWNKYQLSEDYKYRIETGRKCIPGSSVRQNSDCSPKNSDCSPKNLGPIIEENRRENITTSSECSVEVTSNRHPDDMPFASFWAAYPKRVGKQAALKAWQKQKPDIDKCLKTLEWQKKSDQWTKEGGQYIPLPATWLNQGRWDDVSPAHTPIICPRCGNEGVISKGHKGTVKCGKCNHEAAAGQIRGVKC
jgi:hypothetical protein